MQTMSVPVHQEIVIDNSFPIKLVGRRKTQTRFCFFAILSVLFAGFPILLARWAPRLYFLFVTHIIYLESATHVLITDEYGNSSLVIVQRNTYVSFEYRGAMFILDPNSKLFVQNTNFIQIPLETNGLQISDVSKYQTLFGQNSMLMPTKSFMKIVWEEITHPVSCFQIFAMILWSLNDYFMYSCVIFLIFAVSATSSIRAEVKFQRGLRKTSTVGFCISVFRDSAWTTIKSNDLVPGDVFEIDGVLDIPCDAIILSGQLICDETFLTGESSPIAKSPVPLDSTQFIPESSVVFNGSTVIKKISKDDEKVVAIAAKTGFNTRRGMLMRSMMFPKPNIFKFYREAVIFLLIFALISFLGFLLCVVLFVIQGVPIKEIIIRGFDLIIVVFPPALPATLSVGIVFAVNRLRKKRIVCNETNKVVTAGSLDYICFDKTGTLTEDGMNIVGVVHVESEKCQLEFIEIKDHTKVPDALLMSMITCHSIVNIDGQCIGDPIEIEMFKCTKWILSDDSYGGLVTILRSPTEQGKELGIIRSFEFCSKIRRMSVVVKCLLSESFSLICKGAPESIVKICNTSTIPKNYDSILTDLTQSGFRVLALADRPLECSWFQVQKLDRMTAESHLNFIGFLVFENKLKLQTVDVLSSLKKANFKMSMCTGDNSLTGISVSRSCGIVEKSQPVYLAAKGANQIEFVNIANEGDKLDSVTLQSKSFENYCIACGGEEYQVIYETFTSSAFSNFLDRCVVYARMTPEQKQHLVSSLQKEGLKVGFCGDGANDAKALKAADVGIFLSSNEVSIAAAFTSSITNISCIPIIVREGRTALVTALSYFKYMVLYSVIQCCSMCILYCVGHEISDGQFTYIDLLLIIPTGILMNNFRANSKIYHAKPSDSLISVKIIFRMISFIVLQLVSQLSTLFFTLDSVKFMHDVPTKKSSISMFASSNFILCNYFYILAAVLFCDTAPYRETFYSNKKFLLFNIFLGLLAVCLNYANHSNPLSTLLSLYNHTVVQKFVIFMISAVSCLLICLIHYLMAPRVSKYMRDRQVRKQLRWDRESLTSRTQLLV